MRHLEPHASRTDDPAGRWGPRHGNQGSAWEQGDRFDFAQPNPEYR